MFTTPQDIKVKMFRSHREENRQRYVKKKRNYVKLSMSHTKKVTFPRPSQKSSLRITWNPDC